MILPLPEGFPETEGVVVDRHTDWQTPALKVGIVNLMPLKRRTEADLLGILDADTAVVDVDFISMRSHRLKSAYAGHVDRFYIPSDIALKNHYDALIVTGAPVELMEFEQVDYWDELTRLIDHASANVKSTMFICWGAFAALYHRYQIGKRLLPSKLSGVYTHSLNQPSDGVVAGFESHFEVPHSRNTEIDPEALDRCADLSVIAWSDRTGAHLIEGRGGRVYYVMGHWEYAPDTLDMEYRRDSDKGLSPLIPENYYIGDNPANGYQARWQRWGRLFFHNWLKSLYER